MPFQSIEYRQHLLLPAQSGGLVTVLIRAPNQVTCHHEVATGEDYQEAIWRAQRIVDSICEKASTGVLAA